MMQTIDMKMLGMLAIAAVGVILGLFFLMG